jgi:hypothetical protein
VCTANFVYRSKPYVFQQQVSLSPQDHLFLPNVISSGQTIQVQSCDPYSPSSGRVLYPSPNYAHGNPGFYYDPIHFLTSVGSQTDLRFHPSMVDSTIHLPTGMCPPTQQCVHPAFGSVPVCSPSPIDNFTYPTYMYNSSNLEPDGRGLSVKNGISPTGYSSPHSSTFTISLGDTVDHSSSTPIKDCGHSNNTNPVCHLSSYNEVGCQISSSSHVNSCQ